jgi:hypothetical protein
MGIKDEKRIYFDVMISPGELGGVKRSIDRDAPRQAPRNHCFLAGHQLEWTEANHEKIPESVAHGGYHHRG